MNFSTMTKVPPFGTQIALGKVPGHQDLPNAALEDKVLRSPKKNSGVRYPLFHFKRNGGDVEFLVGPSFAAMIIGVLLVVTGAITHQPVTAGIGAGTGIIGWLLRGRY